MESLSLAFLGKALNGILPALRDRQLVINDIETFLAQLQKSFWTTVIEKNITFREKIWEKIIFQLYKVATNREPRIPILSRSNYSASG